MPLAIAVFGGLLIVITAGQRRLRAIQAEKLRLLSPLVGHDVALYVGDRMQERLAGKLNTVHPTQGQVILKMPDGALRPYLVKQIKAIEVDGRLVEL